MEVIAQANTTSPNLSTILDEPSRAPRDLVVKEGHSTPPHFMTSTVASRRSEKYKSIDQAVTPFPIKSIKIDGGHSLLKSAVKRVGLRGDHSTPRGKKESRMNHSGMKISPDKLFSSPSTGKTDHPPTTSNRPKDASHSSPLNKPLPDLPLNHVNLSSPNDSSSSLAEQIDDPLLSSAFESSSSEEGAGTEPNAALTPDTLQKRTGQTVDKSRRPSGSGEKHSELGNAIHQPRDTGQQREVSRYSRTEQVLPHKISSPSLRNASSTNHTLHVVTGLSDPFGDDAEVIDLVVNARQKASIESIKAAAAAIEKSAKEPTKTSSLRARLSTGQIVKDNHSKVLGFTDFTAQTAPTDSSTGVSRRDSYRARKELEAQNRRSSDSLPLSVRTKASAPSLRRKPLAQTLRPNKSTESFAKGHAPAQVVGGSRRPGLAPQSRSNIWDLASSSVPGPFRRPSSHQSHTPSPSLEKRAIPDGSPCPIIEGQVKPRRSSIPLPKHLHLNVASKGSDHKVATSSAIQADTLDRMSQDKLSIFEDQSSSDLPLELEAKTKVLSLSHGSVQTFSDAIESRTLAAIEESPQQRSKSKYDTMNSPQFGPRLRISPSAERFIMGTSDADVSNKENRPVHKKATQTFLQKATNGVYKQPTTFFSPSSNMSFGLRSGRPNSSHGLLQSSPRHESFHPSARGKKAKSADLSSTLFMKPTSSVDLNSANMDAFNASKSRKDSPSDESYFDAEEKLRNSSNDGLLMSERQVSEHLIIDEAAWISPVKEKNGRTLAKLRKTQLISSTPIQGENLKEVKPQHERASPKNAPKVSSLASPSSSQLSANTQKHNLKQEFCTLVHPSNRTASSSSSFPPRSSSRIAHTNEAAKILSASPLCREKGPPTLPKDDLHRKRIQNFDPKFFDVQHRSTFQESIRRDSHQSGISHSSLKKPFSNIRNLFNKRTTPPESSDSNFNKLHLSKKPSISQKRRTNIQNTSAVSHGTPLPPVDSIPRTQKPKPTPTNRVITPRNATSSSVAATPVLTTPAPSSVSTATNLAMDLLTAARNEQFSPRKEQLLQMSKIMVDAITRARDAEKAAEEAKLAARKAEVAQQICEGLVGEVGRLMTEWRADVMGAGEMI